MRSDVWSSIVSSAFAEWTLAIWPIAHREEGADVAVARQFEVGLLLLEHPPQGLWSLHLVPQHPRIHPDVSGRALLWRLSDNGPSARGTVRGGPSSETLHTSSLPRCKKIGKASTSRPDIRP